MKRDLAREREIAKAVGRPRVWRPGPTFAPRAVNTRAGAAWVRRQEAARKEEATGRSLMVGSVLDSDQEFNP